MKRRLLFSSFAVLLAFSGRAFAENIRETPVVKAIQKCAPLVVNISTERTVLLRQNPFWGIYGGQFDNFFNSNPGQYSQTLGTMNLQSLGSGVIVSSDGLIATNAHVVGMASRIFVKLSNGETKEAVLIGTDNENDIALVQIDAPKGLPYMEIETNPLIGETVVSIGSPLGLQNSVSAGIVSGTERTFTANPPTHIFKDLIQTDASINPGSSGGALIDLEGRLVGINFAVVQNAQGLGFAVPAEKIKKMLAEYEKVRSKKPAVKTV